MGQIICMIIIEGGCFGRAEPEYRPSQPPRRSLAARARTKKATRKGYLGYRDRANLKVWVILRYCHEMLLQTGRD